MCVHEDRSVTSQLSGIFVATVITTLAATVIITRSVVVSVPLAIPTFSSTDGFIVASGASVLAFSAVSATVAMATALSVVI
ncbi:unnamed protein product [Fusarium graminearum]|nr:unnamed protein product [Fusarium graminearum]